MKHYKTFFKLNVYYIDLKRDRQNNDLMPRYPEFKLRKETLGYYTSLPKAEAEMRRHIKSLKSEDWHLNRGKDCKKINNLLYLDTEDNQICSYRYGELYCFHINEKRLNCTCVWNTDTRRSYSPEGKLLDTHLTAEEYRTRYIKQDADYTREELNHLGAFVGRKPEEIRFHPGDIVEVMHGDCVALGIVSYSPSSEEDMEKTRGHFYRLYPGRHDRYYWRDYSDDCYCILIGDKVYHYKDGNDPQHFYDTAPSFGVIVFAPRFTVSRQMRKQLHKAYLAWQSHPLIIQCLEQSSAGGSVEFREYYDFVKAGEKMPSERVNALLAEMDAPFRLDETHSVADEAVPQQSFALFDTIKSDSDKCAALCYGLKKYMEGVDWK
jgi:hypothetical protein